MARTKAIVGIEEIAGLMKGLRSARQQSPFFTMVIRDEWLVSFDYAIVIHSIHSMLKNSIHSIQKLMNGPTAIISIWVKNCENLFVPNADVVPKPVKTTQSRVFLGFLVC